MRMIPSGSRQGQMVGYCEQGNEHCGSIERWRMIRLEIEARFHLGRNLVNKLVVAQMKTFRGF
jgi:hypothetical protein